MKKILITLTTIVIIIAIGIGINLDVKETEASGVMGPSFLTASSTAFTLTTTSQRLLGTTTQQGQSGARVTAVIQPTSCTTAAFEGAFLSLNGNVSTAGQGLLAYASTTVILGDHVNQIPNIRGSIHGITRAGTCTVLVTEWRTQ